MNLFPIIGAQQEREYLCAARIRRAEKIAGWRNAHMDLCEREAKKTFGNRLVATRGGDIKARYSSRTGTAGENPAFPTTPAVKAVNAGGHHV